MIGVFAALKWRLWRNGLRRTMKSRFAAFGFVMSAIGALVAGVTGCLVFASLRWSGLDGTTNSHRIVVIGAALMVFGWWFAPLLSGGVDETVDPSRLVLLPLSRSQIRRGQVVGGLIGMAPLAMLAWSGGLVAGLAPSAPSAVVVVVGALLLPIAGLVGSRALASTLARMTRSRRGGDVAGLIAAAGGAAIFALLQLARFVDAEDLDPAVRVLRWTPPGMVGESLEGASRGELLIPLLRLVPVVALIVVAGWWWARQLDALLTSPQHSGGGGIQAGTARLAIFSGARALLPHTPLGAGLAREVVYLRRSPGRRAALISGVLLGLVYVVVFVQGLALTPAQRVLAAPLAMLFSLQYASNQFGVDPTSFWLDVVTGAPPQARVVGRQLLAAVTLFVPVLVAAVVVSVWGRVWVESVAAMAATLVSLPSIVGVGSLASPAWAVPIPDSGNPFSNRQTLTGNGCMAGLVGFLFMLLVAGLIVPIEVGLAWAVHSHEPLWFVVILMVAVGINAVIWRTATRGAGRSLLRREVQILARLDARLSR